ncbi:MAG: Mobile element protein [Nitrospira sp.]|jgi:putative transposase|nr:Mobile element protein [Nitrospira sp.]
MARREFRDDQWKHSKELVPGKASDPGRTAPDTRKFVDAVLWIARTGAHWRELPASFGAWDSVFQRYNRWSNAGVWARVFRALSGDPDCEYVMIDSTIVRAHQHAAGAKGGLKRRKPWAVRKAG